jgi:hypothetical protein
MWLGLAPGVAVFSLMIWWPERIDQALAIFDRHLVLVSFVAPLSHAYNLRLAYGQTHPPFRLWTMLACSVAAAAVLVWLYAHLSLGNVLLASVLPVLYLVPSILVHEYLRRAKLK